MVKRTGETHGFSRHDPIADRRRRRVSSIDTVYAIVKAVDPDLNKTTELNERLNRDARRRDGEETPE